MKILVTGGSGFIGSHLLEELTHAGHHVVSLDIRDPENRKSKIEYIRLDFCDHEKLSAVFAQHGFDAVCHLGALPSNQQSIKEPYVSLRSNVSGMFSVLEAARAHGVHRFVFASSAAVYGKTAFEKQGEPLTENDEPKPLNGYALAKTVGEKFVSLWSTDEIWKGIDGISLRFFNVFGPRQRRDSAYSTCIEKFLQAWQADEPFTIVPDGNQRRDMVYVKDVVRAIRLAAESQTRFNGAVVNIGSGRNYSILEIADIIGGSKHPRVFIDPRPGEIKISLAEISKAQKLLDWQPSISFEMGIDDIKATL
jgi:UDP-glucose 4-epimerase